MVSKLSVAILIVTLFLNCQSYNPRNDIQPFEERTPCKYCKVKMAKQASRPSARQMFDGGRSSLEEKPKGNRRKNWERRKVMRDGKKWKNECGEKRKNHPNNVRLLINRWMMLGSHSFFSNGALSIDMKLRFGNGRRGLRHHNNSGRLMCLLKLSRNPSFLRRPTLARRSRGVSGFRM